MGWPFSYLHLHKKGSASYRALPFLLNHPVLQARLSGKVLSRIFFSILPKTIVTTVSTANRDNALIMKELSLLGVVHLRWLDEKYATPL